MLAFSVFEIQLEMHQTPSFSIQICKKSSHPGKRYPPHPRCVQECITSFFLHP